MGVNVYELAYGAAGLARQLKGYHQLPENLKHLSEREIRLVQQGYMQGMLVQAEKVEALCDSVTGVTNHVA